VGGDGRGDEYPVAGGCTNQRKPLGLITKNGCNHAVRVPDKMANHVDTIR
jgi:hypothetical protein